MGRRVFILAANPNRDSFTTTLAAAYATAAQEEHEVRLVNLSDMAFNPDLSGGYATQCTMEASLTSFQDSLSWCNHLVIVAPVWWGAFPAKLKGLIDRTFLPGFAFRYKKGSQWPEKLLQGKTARIVLTMDTPPWYYTLIQGAPAIKQLKQTTLKFVGFGTVKSTMFGPVIHSTEATRLAWVGKVSKLGYAAG